MVKLYLSAGINILLTPKLTNKILHMYINMDMYIYTYTHIDISKMYNSKKTGQLLL